MIKKCFLIIRVKLIYSGISCAPQTRKRNASQKQCAEQSTYENCIQTLLTIAMPEKHFPNTTEQLTEFCGKLKDVKNCIKDYTHKCFSPSQIRATVVAIAGMARSAKRMCKSPSIQQGLYHFIIHKD
jgi:hypothetical protein